jgi:hypothetical protein
LSMQKTLTIGVLKRGICSMFSSECFNGSFTETHRRRRQ